MDGRDRRLDNAFVERLWRSLKCECVYPHAFEAGLEVRAGLKRWIELYNTRRPHSALAGRGRMGWRRRLAFVRREGGWPRYYRFTCSCFSYRCASIVLGNSNMK
jgi:transposase InsO family protein